MLARAVLETQLVKLGIIQPGDSIKQFDTFNALYQNSKSIIYVYFFNIEKIYFVRNFKNYFSAIFSIQSIVQLRDRLFLSIFIYINIYSIIIYI